MQSHTTRLHRPWASALLGLLSLACVDIDGSVSSPTTPNDPAPDDPRPDDSAPFVTGPWHHQVDCAPDPTGELASWRHPLISRLTVELGGDDHSIRDVVVTPGAPISVEGKFAYGATSKDLEDEDVALFVALDGDCAWTAVGDARTNSDGRASVDVDPALFPGPGRYPVRFLVRGDGTGAFGFVHVLRTGTPLVVFDIDGTLTTDDMELVDGIVLHTVEHTSETLFDLAGSPLTKAEWLWGLEQVLDEDAQMYEAAPEVVRAYVAMGAQPVFITARPYVYDAMTRRWLDTHGFPPGPLVMTADVLDAMPARVAAYKADSLGALEDAGMHLHAAYGNATTDICAYTAAGVPAERMFIMGPNGGDACDGGPASQAVTSYPEHLAAGLPEL